ncbi:MFS family permease [Paenarthrobacter nitroguajacolicus]|uniref:MFS transporter n=1 Tax=Paenarthrobacter nitroguajacolicus TaxID=211146 RepID=UPI0028577578|nr:MFS transporter [Paenarthrobacter nitroguajacolicus]MDR6989130.1 MFS family permease [Paenarthrobacter nitroguajacolicus]
MRARQPIGVTRILLGTQLVFNLGFYAVVPFLAGAMGNDFGMDAAAIGFVLGARTFSQQGMFLIGGMVADRWGAKRAILLGCLVRIGGYAALAAAYDFPLFLLGAILTGAGGALFSPALESQLGRTELSNTKTQRTDRGRPRSVFVWLAITGEFGALLGPLIGAALLGWGFDAALTLGMGVFTVVAVALWIQLPSDPRPDQLTPDGTATPRRLNALASLGNRPFVIFCALASVKMLAYNQLYFLIPLELGRRGLDDSLLAALFLMASLLTIALQLPVSSAVRRIGHRRAIPVGFLLLAAAFTVGAFPIPQTASQWQSIATMGIIVALLILGHMTLTPTILALIPEFLPDDAAPRLGAYYGLAASCGGIAVLVGNTAVGQVRYLTEHAAWTGAPWLLLVALMAAPALILPRTIPTPRPEPSPAARA